MRGYHCLKNCIYRLRLKKILYVWILRLKKNELNAKSKNPEQILRELPDKKDEKSRFQITWLDKCKKQKIEFSYSKEFKRLNNNKIGIKIFRAE